MNRQIMVIVLGLFMGLTLGRTTADAERRSVLEYTLYKQVLAQYVNDQGLVNYAELKKNPGLLKKFIDQVEKVNVNFMSPIEKKTFWLNAYNAITLQVVTDHYPVNSIRRINFGLVWNVGRKVAMGKYSLGHIEHKILRPMGDPRVHFALNCASIGCPELPNVPFDPERLDEQLDAETRAFINNPEKVRIDKEEGILYYSAIFDWFEEDFLVIAPDIKGYIMRYLNDEDRIWLEKNSVQIKVMDYDWGLNKQRS